jgi:hypothetical protein
VIDIRIDPWPDEDELGALMRAAWADDAATGNVARLERSLVHAGAYDAGHLIGFVNVAWDGGIHAFILRCSFGTPVTATTRKRWPWM